MTFIDLFAGLGGFRLALESLGATCVYSNEWDRPVQNVYREKILVTSRKGTSPKWMNIRFLTTTSSVPDFRVRLSLSVASSVDLRTAAELFFLMLPGLYGRNIQKSYLWKM